MKIKAAEDARVIYRYFHVDDSKENVAWHSGDRGVSFLRRLVPLMENHKQLPSISGCKKPCKQVDIHYQTRCIACRTGFPWFLRRKSSEHDVNSRFPKFRVFQNLFHCQLLKLIQSIQQISILFRYQLSLYVQICQIKVITTSDPT